MRRSERIRAIGAASAVWLSSVACAGVFEVAWTHPGDGLFQHGANWSSGAAPSSAHTAVFALPIPLTVTFGAGTLNTGLVARAGAQVTLELAGFPYLLGGASSLVVGDGAGAGTLLTLRGGEASGLNVEVGADENSVGTLVVRGEGASLDAALDLFVARGERAIGAFAVVDGAGASARSAYFAFDDESLGAGLISGGGSSLTCDQDLVVAQFGEASLDVHGGGSVWARDVAAGRSSASSGTLRIAGPESELFTLFKLSMGSGFGAAGRLEISGGGAARSLFGVLAEIQSSDGDADIAGAGSWWDVDDALYVGFRGDGSLRIADGARVDSKFSVIGHYENATGVALVEGQGALWVNEGQIEVAAAGAGPCALVVESGATVRSAHVLVGSAGELAGGGVVESSVRLVGVHRPGLRSGSGGASAIVGAYSIDPAGTLELDIAGLTPALQHDVLVVVGRATLGGALRLLWDESFDPPLGSTMAVVHATELRGWFDAVEAPALRWPKRAIVEREGEIIVVRIGLRRLSEWDSLLPEDDGGIRPKAAPGRPSGAPMALLEWVWAASRGWKSDGRFQP